MGYLTADKLINGIEGSVIATINGNVREMAEITKLEATAEKTKTEFKSLGNRSTQTKANGWKGTGSGTMRYGSKVLRDMMLSYIETGKDTFFDIVVTNDDPEFDGKKIVTKLGRCNIDAALLTRVDIDTDILEEDFNFTFTEVEDL